MATEPDPYRTLGLSPGASADEIRRAYRRLAKANHPDSAGEKALSRFLAIQAAYESLVGSNGMRPSATRPGTARPTSRETWRADPGRARATREGRTPGPDGSATGKRRRPSGDEPRRPAGGRKPPSNKATPGSTTYDAADDEPFEPEWSGGTWYGASSGTYWTINPKEYADPRKHGPEYQRRARRRTGATPPVPDADPGADTDAGSPDLGAGAPSEQEAGTTGPERPTTEAWGRWPDENPGAAAGEPTSPDPAGVAALTGLLGLRGGFPVRIGVALVGWPPIGIAISTIGGEVTGCGRFAAGCVELFGVGTWVAQLAVIALLLALPSVAALSAVGTLAALAASVPAAVILSASGGSREPAASATILAVILVVAYVTGVAFALVRRGRSGAAYHGDDASTPRFP